MATLAAIIFDFDGVIADTEPLHFAGLRQTLAEIGIILTESDYYPLDEHLNASGHRKIARAIADLVSGGIGRKTRRIESTDDEVM